MKSLSVLILFILTIAACNTRFGNNEVTNDSRLNPAELPVDTVGANTDIAGSAATDSNKVGEPMRAPGKSDLQVGSETGQNDAITSDGNYVQEPKDSAPKESK